MIKRYEQVVYYPEHEMFIFKEALLGRYVEYIDHEFACKKWEAKEKALRELADRWMDEMKPTTTPVIHQSLICSEHASDLLVILNREQEKQP